MTECKLTDEEVVAELKSASEWFTEHGRNTNTAIIGICDRAVDLINRKNAEIERLEKGELSKAMTFNSETIKRCVDEAISEFVERLKERAVPVVIGEKYHFIVVTTGDIDNLVKEMTEEKK